MFKISHEISQQDLRIKNKKITEIDIMYDLFPGDIQLRTDSGLIDMSWEWVTVLDFAIFFKRIGFALSQQEDGCKEFGFTENDESIKLCRKKELIEIRPSFEGDTLIVDFEEFCDEVDKFYNSVVEEVCTANPFLRENRDFLQLLNISIKKPLN